MTLKNLTEKNLESLSLSDLFFSSSPSSWLFFSKIPLKTYAIKEILRLLIDKKMIQVYLKEYLIKINPLTLAISTSKVTKLDHSNTITTTQCTKLA